MSAIQPNREWTVKIHWIEKVLDMEATINAPTIDKAIECAKRTALAEGGEVIIWSVTSKKPKRPSKP